MRNVIQTERSGTSSLGGWHSGRGNGVSEGASGSAWKDDARQREEQMRRPKADAGLLGALEDDEETGRWGRRLHPIPSYVFVISFDNG